jgi:hypothetical protein
MKQKLKNTSKNRVCFSPIFNYYLFADSDIFRQKEILKIQIQIKNDQSYYLKIYLFCC